MSQNAAVIRQIDPATLAARLDKPQAQKAAEPEKIRTRPLSSVLGAANNPEADRPVVRLPSGGHRAIASVRVIPHMGFCDVITVPDLSDGGEARTFRLPLNQPVVGWAKVKSE
jgi:hypothetical protein